MSKARIRGYRRSVKRSIIGQDFRLEDRTLLSTTPTLSSVTPDRGVLAGGTSITIVGTNFSSDPSQDVVTLGSVTATITSAKRDAVRRQDTRPNIGGLLLVELDSRGHRLVELLDI